MQALTLKTAHGSPRLHGLDRKGRATIVSAPHIAIFPDLAIMIIVLGFNLPGDGLRAALDPRMKR